MGDGERTICVSCGGRIGFDCFNPSECADIARLNRHLEDPPAPRPEEMGMSEEEKMTHELYLAMNMAVFIGTIGDQTRRLLSERDAARASLERVEGERDEARDHAAAAHEAVQEMLLGGPVAEATITRVCDLPCEHESRAASAEAALSEARLIMSNLSEFGSPDDLGSLCFGCIPPTVEPHSEWCAKARTFLAAKGGGE